MPWQATLSKEEYTALWLDAEYPQQFKARSPRSCIDVSAANDPTQHFGCAGCLEAIDASFPLSTERYCRCMASIGRSSTELSQVDAYRVVCTFSLLENATRLEELLGGSASRAAEWKTLSLQAPPGCQPFCAPMGSFVVGFELAFPPMVPPGAPSAPPRRRTLLWL